MAAQSLTIQGAFTTSSGSNAINDSISVPSPLASTVYPTIITGFNSIPIPTGVTIVYVVLPPGNSQSVTLKGITGDTGLAIQPAGGRIMFMPTSGQTTFGITAAGAIPGLTVYFE